MTVPLPVKLSYIVNVFEALPLVFITNLRKMPAPDFIVVVPVVVILAYDDDWSLT